MRSRLMAATYTVHVVIRIDHKGRMFLLDLGVSKQARESGSRPIATSC